MMQDILEGANWDRFNTFISFGFNTFISILETSLQKSHFTDPFFSDNETVFLSNLQITEQITLQFRSTVYILCITLGWGFAASCVTSKLIS